MGPVPPAECLLSTVLQYRHPGVALYPAGQEGGREVDQWAAMNLLFNHTISKVFSVVVWCFLCCWFL